MKSALNIADLISAPLTASASANSKMLKLQTAYLIETCFEQKDDDCYEPVMIEMSISKSHLDKVKNESASFKDISAKFKVPLLTLIPINTIAVDTVDVNFSLEIVQQKEVKTTTTKNSKTSSNKIFEKRTEAKTELSGRVSYDSSDLKKEHSLNSSKLDVKIHAKSLPLPRGITTLIDLYVNSINAKPKINEND